jgi:hypothetical protein
MNTLKRINEEQIIIPLESFLQEVTPTPSETTQQKKNSPTTIKKSLDNLFPEQQYEDKDIQKTKEILGARAKDLSESELRDIVAETQFLISSWLDDFERKTFNGMTLNELLHEKGGL